MHADLERLLAEDEAARASVDLARTRAHAHLEAIRGELARSRADRLHDLERQLEQTIAAIETETDVAAERRRAQRDARVRDDAARAAGLVAAAADEWVRIVRNGPAPRRTP